MRVKKSSSSSSSSKSEIIQFRVDDRFMSELKLFAERFKTPVGSLVRQWVAERLAVEIAQDKDSLETWRKKRLLEVEKKIKIQLKSGPVLLLHIIPIAQKTTIDVSSARPLVDLLAPLERTDFTFRVNQFGLITEKTFADDDRRSSGYVQLFKTGQIESVRVLCEGARGETRTLFGDEIASDLCKSILFYCSALKQLNIRIPLVICGALLESKGFGLVTSKSRFSGQVIDSDFIEFPELVIADWTELSENKIQLILKPMLEILWNAAGYW